MPSGSFSLALYLKHREYNAAIGAALLYLSLIFLRPALGALARWASVTGVWDERRLIVLPGRRFRAATSQTVEGVEPEGEDPHAGEDDLFVSSPLPPLRYGQQIPLLPPPRPGFTFPQKQTLTYSVDWRVFPAGTAVIHFEADGDRERLPRTPTQWARSILLFHVSDRFQSIFDRTRTAAPTSSTSRRWKAAGR